MVQMVKTPTQTSFDFDDGEDDPRTADELAAEGLVKTGFGIEDVEDLSQWDQISTGIGEKIVWEKENSFVGHYKGESSIEGTNANGVVGQALCYLFTERDGTDRFAWKTYQLEQALQDLPVGTLVRIDWLGKRDIARGQSVNIFRVFKSKT
jgi:hypothetical protein